MKKNQGTSKLRSLVSQSCSSKKLEWAEKPAGRVKDIKREAAKPGKWHTIWHEKNKGAAAPRAAWLLTLPSHSTLRPSYPWVCPLVTIKDTWLCDLPTFRGQREDMGQKVNLRGSRRVRREQCLTAKAGEYQGAQDGQVSVSILKENEDCKEATELKNLQITRDWWSSKGKSDDMPSRHPTELMFLLYT